MDYKSGVAHMNMFVYDQKAPLRRLLMLSDGEFFTIRNTSTLPDLQAANISGLLISFETSTTGNYSFNGIMQTLSSQDALAYGAPPVTDLNLSC